MQVLYQWCSLFVSLFICLLKLWLKQTFTKIVMIVHQHNDSQTCHVSFYISRLTSARTSRLSESSWWINRFIFYFCDSSNPEIDKKWSFVFCNTYGTSIDTHILHSSSKLSKTYKRAVTSEFILFGSSTFIRNLLYGSVSTAFLLKKFSGWFNT